MTETLKIGSIGFVIGLFVAAFAAHFCYDLGFDHGTAEAAARQASAVEIAQKEVKKNYEKRVEELAASLERVRNDNAQRLRELNEFSHARTSLETCRRERGELARLAVRGEELLNRADSYLKALRK
ncbi:hypothetical protein [Parasutterella secunda]|uniref:DUF2570 domain-containing protein n=1 Tax=Parasutterella secunda TaxID=626947 RepID=A0ABS2GVV4_9BURK|nr:hypothetical protein [Parasutterella secunda]MBM6929341.1 hypothetical protein [Parasutterella secunda]